MITFDGIRDRVGAYYEDKIVAHGATARGVDWNSADSQRCRFQQLLRICDSRGLFSLNDFCCGYVSLYDFLREQAIDCDYVGYDVARLMIARAREIHLDDPRPRFVDNQATLEPTDFAVAS